jgi:hypothetical protein
LVSFSLTGMARMEGTAEVVDCGSDEELIVNADRRSEKKSSVRWKRIVGSIPYEKLCLRVLTLHTADPDVLFI